MSKTEVIDETEVIEDNKKKAKKNDKSKKPVVIKEKNYTEAWISIITIFVFFIAFFMAYFVGGHALESTFVKSIVIFIVANIISRGIVIVWQMSYTKQEWLLIAHGPPQVDSRTEKIIKERERQITLVAQRIAEMTKSPAPVEEDDVEEEEEDDDYLN
jgi:small-conductance mechanosensitive channel